MIAQFGFPNKQTNLSLRDQFLQSENYFHFGLKADIKAFIFTVLLLSYHLEGEDIFFIPPKPLLK